MALRQFVVRTAPLTHEAMLIDVASRDNGRLRAIIGNRELEIGMDTYQASGSVDLGAAKKIVHAYAQQNGIPDTDVMVRVRLPKTNVQPRKARKTNDVEATNLTLVKNGEKGDNLQQLAQNLHDSETKQESKVATASNPEGATVKRTEQEKKPRRAYQKKDKEKSARSLAALRRYQEELAATQKESPTLMEPVAHNASPAEYDAAVMELATAIAKILKSNTGVL